MAWYLRKSVNCGLIGLVTVVAYACAAVPPVTQRPARPDPAAEANDARKRLAWAREALAAQHYGRAQAFFQEVLARRKMAATEILTSQEYGEALDGACLTLCKQGTWAEALPACTLAVEESGKQHGSASRDLLVTIQRELRQQTAARIATAITAGDSTTARRSIAEYRGYPGAKRDKIVAWERQIVKIEAADTGRKEREVREQHQREREKPLHMIEQAESAEIGCWLLAELCRSTLVELDRINVAGTNCFSDPNCPPGMRQLIFARNQDVLDSITLPGKAARGLVVRFPDARACVRPLLRHSVRT